MKNGKSFKGKLKSFISFPYGEKEYSFRKIVLYIISFVLLTFLYGMTFSTSSLFYIDKIIVYIFDAIVTIACLTFSIWDIVYINKINKKYKLEDVSSELDETKKRKEEVTKNLELQEKLHQTKLSELKTTMQNIMEVINISSQAYNFDLTNEQVVELDIETKKEGKKLILEKK